MSDPVADLLTRIRNSLQAEHRFVDVPWSKLKQHIVEIFKESGLIENFIVKHETNGGTMRVFLKYTKARKPVIQGLKRVSKPGCRTYVSHDEIPHFFGGYGIAVLSTSKGVMSGRKAVEEKTGGELMCLVW